MKKAAELSILCNIKLELTFNDLQGKTIKLNCLNGDEKLINLNKKDPIIFTLNHVKKQKKFNKKYIIIKKVS